MLKSLKRSELIKALDYTFSRKSAFSASHSPPETFSNLPDIPQPIRSGLQASHARGTGGRLSFSGNVITVFGGTGFIGTSVINALAKDGNQIIVAYRCEPYDVRHLKLCGDLGQILFYPFDLRDEESIRKAVRYSNVVINMMGRTYPTFNFSIHDVNADGARKLAQISREMGVKRFLQFSALNANENPPEFFIPDGSTFLRTKALSERYVRDEFPEATIIRPSNIYEYFDTFFYFYSHPFRRNYFFRWNVYKKGEFTYKSPVSRENVAYGVLQLIRDPTSAGKVFEFVGPHWYKLADLVDWVTRLINRYDEITYGRNHYEGFFTFKTNFFKLQQLISKRKQISDWEMLEKDECFSDLLTGCPTLDDLGVTYDVIEDKVPEIVMFNNKSRSVKRPIDVPPPPYPRRYPPMCIDSGAPASEKYQTTVNPSFNIAA